MTKQFGDILQDDLVGCPPIRCPPAKLEFKDGPMKPIKITNPRRTPIHYRSQADELVRKLLEAKVI